MASWYSNLLTKTTSQISNLRSTLLSSEADGDTEDDTHVCRVLRNYYTEKGRPFPPWLPPDPKAPVQQTVQPLYANAGGNGRMGYAQQQQMGGQQMGGGQQQPGGLSSLWDNGGGAQQQAAPQSLRAGRGMLQRPQPGAPQGGMMPERPTTATSQASYQSNGAPRDNAAGAASAQDRLRQRLRGGRTASPNPAGQSPYQPPAGGGGGYDGSYSQGGGYDGRGGGGQQMGYGGGEYYDGGQQGGRQGLPSGGRRGLPSGPRGYR